MNRKKIERQNGKIVLGDGELTGHQHTIREKSAVLFAIDADARLLVLTKPAVLRHEKGDTPAEHREIKLPADEHLVTHKRAYNPEGSWSPVQD